MFSQFSSMDYFIRMTWYQHVSYSVSFSNMNRIHIFQLSWICHSCICTGRAWGKHTTWCLVSGRGMLTTAQGFKSSSIWIHTLLTFSYVVHIAWRNCNWREGYSSQTCCPRNNQLYNEQVKIFWSEKLLSSLNFYLVVGLVNLLLSSDPHGWWKRIQRSLDWGYMYEGCSHRSSKNSWKIFLQLFNPTQW